MKGLATVISDQFQGCYNDSGTVACNTCTTVITHVYNGNGIYVTYTMLKSRRGYHLYPHLSMVYPVNNFGRTKDVPKALSRSRLLCSRWQPVIHSQCARDSWLQLWWQLSSAKSRGQKDIIGSSQRRQFNKCKWSRCLWNITHVLCNPLTICDEFLCDTWSQPFPFCQVIYQLQLIVAVATETKAEGESVMKWWSGLGKKIFARSTRKKLFGCLATNLYTHKNRAMFCL